MIFAYMPNLYALLITYKLGTYMPNLFAYRVLGWQSNIITVE